jgi:hypothetical protein
MVCFAFLFVTLALVLAAVAGGVDARANQVAASRAATCVVTGDNTVKCWGGQYFTPAQNSPPGDNFAAVTMSSMAACALTLDGGVFCWTGGGMCLIIGCPDFSGRCAASQHLILRVRVCARVVLLSTLFRIVALYAYMSHICLSQYIVARRYR